MEAFSRFLYGIGWFLGNNNGRCAAFWLVTLVVFLVAVFSGYGEPVLSSAVSEKIAEVNRSEYNQAVYDAWNYAKRQEAQVVAPFHGWLLWILVFPLFAFSFIYTLVAFREEIREAWDEVGRRVREKREAEAQVSAEPVVAATAPASSVAVSPHGVTWGRLFKFEVVSELIGVVFERLMGFLFGRRR